MVENLLSGAISCLSCRIQLFSTSEITNLFEPSPEATMRRNGINEETVHCAEVEWNKAVIALGTKYRREGYMYNTWRDAH